MIDNRIKKVFLQELEQTGNVFRSCKRVGIPHTSTIYRWAAKSAKFKQQMEEAQRIGRLNAVDVAEGGMVNNAADGDYKSQVFLLRHLSPLYKPQPRQVNIEHKGSGDQEGEFELMKREHWAQISEAMAHITELVRNLELSDKDTEKILANLPHVDIVETPNKP